MQTLTFKTTILKSMLRKKISIQVSYFETEKTELKLKTNVANKGYEEKLAEIQNENTKREEIKDIIQM